MRLIRKLRWQAGWLLRRARVEADLSDELQDYVERQTARHQEQGLSREEARRAALCEVGGVEQVKEKCRDARPVRLLEAVLQDARYGLRQLRKSPGFTLTAVLTLGLGIGVNTTIFSVVSSILLRKPPIDEPDRVVMLLSRDPGAGATDEASRLPVSALDFLDWREEARSFSGMAASSSHDFTLNGGTEPERLTGAQVTANYFELLGEKPILGRSFKAGEDAAGHDRVALLREDLWKGRFGGDRGIVGQAVEVDGEKYTVIGVMPASFRKLWLFPAQLWVPLTIGAEERRPAARRSGTLDVFARLKPGVGEGAARAEIVTIAKRMAAAHPEGGKERSASLMTMQSYVIAESGSETALLFLQGAVGFVLLIACANMVNLMLARNSARGREFAIRTALGAGRMRLAGQLFAECLLLALAGGGLGLALAFWGIRMLRAGLDWNEYSVRVAEQMSIDGTVLLFTLAVSVGTALLCGLAPALRVSRGGANRGLKESARGTTAGREKHRVQNLLVVGEIAASLILLAGAGLFVGNFVQEVRARPGMNAENLLTASVRLSGTNYHLAEQQTAFFQNVLRHLALSPEVVSAAVTSALPFSFPGAARVVVEGRPEPETEKQAVTSYYAVSGGYFSAAQISLQEGREFTAFDKSGSKPVMVVNRAFAEKFFPHETALGRRVHIEREGSSGASGRPAWSEIVGVVGNVSEFLGQRRPRPQVFEPFLQEPQETMNLLVRLRSDPNGFGARLRQAAWSVDRNQPVTNLRSMRRVIRDAGNGDDLMAELMGGFAGVALVMAAFGIYGLIAYLVARRTQEIGVRMAVGASQGQVLLLVLRNSMSLAIAGVVVGFTLSLPLPRLTAALFNDFHVNGGWIIGGTTLIVILVTAAASWFPAHRASKIDPLVALRNE